MLGVRGRCLKILVKEDDVGGEGRGSFKSRGMEDYGWRAERRGSLKFDRRNDMVGETERCLMVKGKFLEKKKNSAGQH